MRTKDRKHGSGRRAWILPSIALGIMALFAWGGHQIVRWREAGFPADPGIDAADPVASAVARGRWLFWTRARCHTCHKIEGRGQAVRGPDLDDGPQGAAIGARADARAVARGRKLGTAVSAADYLVESLLDPAAYLVEGYRNEMPPAREPPASLEAADVRALVAYLQSVGGSVDLPSIRIPVEKVRGFIPEDESGP